MKKLFFILTGTLLLFIFAACKKSETINIIPPENKEVCTTEKVTPVQGATVIDGIVKPGNYVMVLTPGGQTFGVLTDGLSLTAGQVITVYFKFSEDITNFYNWQQKPYIELFNCGNGRGKLFERHAKKQ